MRLPTRITPQHPLRRIVAAVLIAVAATLVGVGAHHTPLVSIALSALDETLYDAFYRFRKPVDRTASDIVIITADESSMKALAKEKKIHWPWPRSLWGQTVQYMEQCGAKAVAFDLVFEEPMSYDREFGQALDAAKIPVVMGTVIESDGKPRAFTPVVKIPPKFGAVNVIDDIMVRTYKSEVHGTPSLAYRTVEALNVPPPAWAASSFRLHYFGPTKRADGGHTYRYVPAYPVFVAAQTPAKAASLGLSPDMFKGKIVLIGGTALGIYDPKSSPLSQIYPGVEVQATAIDDLLTGQYVRPLAALQSAAAALAAALVAAFGVILPRRVTLKVAFAFLAAAALIGTGIAIFVAHDIRWLPMASPLFALLLTTVGAFAWTYLREDRQRRLVLKALTQYLSPEVAAEIERDPAALRLGGQRRDMTVMFTDIQGFTDLSESMESERLSEMLNFYLGEMSAQVLDNNGTLDKYIGDAIMSFWNAPLRQEDHAALACRAALAMKRREAEIQPALAGMGAPGLLTRIGINTGPMIFGNLGAPQKFNYTVLGDSVNLGSRLEGANKFYGSRILVAESTAILVKDRFILRQLDLLRVKGKLKPLAVYELLAERQEGTNGNGAADLHLRVTRYEEALALYRAQKWADAQAALEDLHKRFPDDGPSAALIKRIAKLRHDPPGADWDGVYVAKDK
ncbi:MAG TPA: adenylate/guanylate cyclase domain-containing protein [Tepidisphaeraceae bacterium]|jgi:adenylate cyclase|nr:adenylate/guanylate cyclase domain-containing protein [Tepidisphaeraceae bacterium]